MKNTHLYNPLIWLAVLIYALIIGIIAFVQTVIKTFKEVWNSRNQPDILEELERE